MRTLPCLALLAVTVLTGCGSTVIESGSEFTLRLDQTGGFAGVEMTTSVDSASKTISFRPSSDESVQTDDLSDAELETLRARLNDADLASGGGPYRCDGCADQFTFEAHLSVDGSKSDVLWDGVPDSPAELNALATEITKLDGAHFSREL